MSHKTYPKPAPKPKARRRPLPFRSEKGQAYEDELAEVAKLVHARSGFRCEAALDGCTVGVTSTPHHRKRRTQGGPNTLANLLDVCPPCHTHIHAHPDFSYARGLLIRHYDPITPYDGGAQ